MNQNEVTVSTEVLADRQRKHTFRVPKDATLLAIMQEGASRAEVTLLPSSAAPLDALRNVRKHHEIGPPIEPLTQTIDQFLSVEGNTNDFAIDLLRVIKVNNRFKVAPETEMTPRQILELFGLRFEEYTLYLENSTDLLPLDTPLALSRGDVFEAQKDGKYGWGD